MSKRFNNITTHFIIVIIKLILCNFRIIPLPILTNIDLVFVLRHVIQLF